MEKALRAARVALAILTAAVCLALIWQAVDIYRIGNSPSNFSAPGVRIQPVYSRPIVTERLGAVAPLLYGYAGAAVSVMLWQALAGKKARPAIQKPAPQPGTAPRWLRPALYVAAGALILLGALNGGARDVLVKAINICTECIGLG